MNRQINVANKSSRVMSSCRSSSSAAQSGIHMEFNHCLACVYTPFVRRHQTEWFERLRAALLSVGTVPVVRCLLSLPVFFFPLFLLLVFMLIVPSGSQSCGEVEEQTSRRTLFLTGDV